MNAADKIYTTLCVVFAVFIVVGNLIYQKFVFLPILPFHTFELSVGAITYPLTFMLTDLIAEFYGKNKANFCVRLAIAMNIIIAMQRQFSLPWCDTFLCWFGGERIIINSSFLFLLIIVS